MKTFLVLSFVLCTAPPFAFYVVHAASTGKPISPGFIKAYGALLITIFGFALASSEGVELMNALRASLRGLASLKLW
jgi:hypothetical protein